MKLSVFRLRLAAIFAGLFMVCLSSRAQLGDLYHNWAIGFNAGGIYNTVTFVPKVKQNPYFGYTGGVTARYISEKYLSVLLCGVQAEINYVNRGWDENPEDASYKYRREMNSIEVPFFAHLAYGGDKLQAFLNIGPQFSYMLFDKEIYSGDVNTNRLGKAVDTSFDYGIAGGLGVELKTVAGNFLLEGRYYFGLSDFYNNGKLDPYSRSAHGTISLRLTYLIDITK